MKTNIEDPQLYFIFLNFMRKLTFYMT